MDLEILEIASNTENHKVLKKHTHHSRNKNPLCGDEMEISLMVKDNIVQDMGYQCKSCVYCQASVSLLSKWVIQVPIERISDFVSNAEFFFDENFYQSKKINIKDLKDFKKIKVNFNTNYNPARLYFNGYSKDNKPKSIGWAESELYFASSNVLNLQYVKLISEYNNNEDMMRIVSSIQRYLQYKKYQITLIIKIMYGIC